MVGWAQEWPWRQVVMAGWAQAGLGSVGSMLQVEVTSNTSTVIMVTVMATMVSTVAHPMVSSRLPMSLPIR